jgi:hypothetical protein
VAQVHEGGTRRLEVLEALPTLPAGAAYVYSPAWLNLFQRVQIRRRWTYDSAATPKLGAVRTQPKLAEVDLARLEAQMAATIEQAKENDPQELRKRIRDLQRDLHRERARKVATEVREVEKRVEVKVYPQELPRWAESLRHHAEGLARLADDASAAMSGSVPDRQDADQVARREPAITAPRAREARPAAVLHRESEAPKAEELSGSQQRILDALAWLESVGMRKAQRAQLAGFAGQSPTGGGYANNLGRLRTAGLIDYPAARMVGLTDAGRDVAHPPDVPPTSEALQEQVCRMVSSSQAAILRCLIRSYPAPVAREDLARDVQQSATGGGFANNLGRLRTLGWIDYPRPGHVVALPVLFLERAS